MDVHLVENVMNAFTTRPPGRERKDPPSDTPLGEVANRVRHLVLQVPDNEQRKPLVTARPRVLEYLAPPIERAALRQVEGDLPAVGISAVEQVLHQFTIPREAAPHAGKCRVVT